MNINFSRKGGTVTNRIFVNGELIKETIEVTEPEITITLKLWKWEKTWIIKWKK